MSKRLLGWITAGIFGVLCVTMSVHAQSNTIGFPASTLCPNTMPPLSSGTNPGFPGAWWNP